MTALTNSTPEQAIWLYGTSELNVGWMGDWMMDNPQTVTTSRAPPVLKIGLGNIFHFYSQKNLIPIDSKKSKCAYYGKLRKSESGGGSALHNTLLLSLEFMD